MEWITKTLLSVMYAFFFWVILGMDDVDIKYAAILGVFYQSFEEIKQLLKEKLNR